jgi:hypothetical protein
MSCPVIWCLPVFASNFALVDMRSFVNHSFAAYLLIILIVSTLGASQCYWPDGSVDSDGVPCNSTGASACCSAGSQCTSNKLCVVDDPVAGWEYYRGSCTDMTWQDPACPDFCDDGEMSLQSSPQTSDNDQDNLRPTQALRWPFAQILEAPCLSVACHPVKIQATLAPVWTANRKSLSFWMN